MRQPLGAALDAYVLAQAQKDRRVTEEIVEALLDNGRVQVRGQVVPTSGTAKVRVGQLVPVVWEKQQAILVYAGTGLKAQFVPGTSTLAQVGVVETLFIARGDDGLRDVSFRNYEQIVKLGVRGFLGGEPTGVKWGSDRISFAVSSGAGNAREWAVFAFPSDRKSVV